MDTSILRKATRLRSRHGGSTGRTWATSLGQVNMLNTGCGLWADAMAVSWPDPEGGRRCGVRVDWHKAIAKAELRKLMAKLNGSN